MPLPFIEPSMTRFVETSAVGGVFFRRYHVPTRKTIWGYNRDFLKCEAFDEQGASLNYVWFEPASKQAPAERKPLRRIKPLLAVALVLLIALVIEITVLAATDLHTLPVGPSSPDWLDQDGGVGERHLLWAGAVSERIGVAQAVSGLALRFAPFHSS